MADRPRVVWIGTDNAFVLEEFKNEDTGQLITGITTGTCEIWEAVQGTMLASLPLDELPEEPGSYRVIIPDTQSSLGEGLPLMLRFEISGGAGLALRLDARAVARVKTDDGL
jgi:hypothetical protein